MSEENKDLALTTEDQDGIDLIRKMTGEYGAQDMSTLPQYINFSGKDGNYAEKVGEDYIEIGKEIHGTIFKVTKKVQTAMGSKTASVNVRSGEVNDTSNLELVDIVSKDVIATGDYMDLKDEYDLKLSNVLYMYLEEMDTYVRLEIKGSSLGNLWKYLQGFGKNDTVARWKTKFGVDKAEFTDDTGMKIKYYKATFARDGEVEKEKLQGILDELAKTQQALGATIEKKLELTDTGEEVDLDKEFEDAK